MRPSSKCHVCSVVSNSRWFYASAVDGDVATLDEIREAVTTLEDTDRIARRVLGSAHPLVGNIEIDLRRTRVVLAHCETPRS